MSVRAKAVLALAAAGATFALLFTWRGFFVQHATLVSLAVGALVYTTLGTVERLGRSYRKEGPRSVRRRHPED